MTSANVTSRAKTGRRTTTLLRHQEPLLAAKTSAPETAVHEDALDGPPTAVLNRISWQGQYAARLLLTDTVVVTGAVMLAQYVRFGSTPTSPGYASHYVTAYSMLIAVIWLLMLAASHSRSLRVIGVGIEEYRRVVAASFVTFGAIAMAELLVKLEISRGYLAVALPAGTLGLVLSRWTWRKYVAGKRVEGGYRTAVLAIGERDAVAHLAADLTLNATD